jgi:plasmid stabilization system protein ParE
VARKWVDELFARAATLRHHPRRERCVPEVGRNDVREILFGEFRIIYRLDTRRVVILTVRHGRRLWDPSEIEPELE